MENGESNETEFSHVYSQKWLAPGLENALLIYVQCLGLRIQSLILNHLFSVDSMEYSSSNKSDMRDIHQIEVL